MPAIEIIYYKDDDGSCPVIEWLDSLPTLLQIRHAERIIRLESAGHELRRPHCENLGDGLYELRIKWGRENYRLIYFFEGRRAAILTHGFVKDDVVPVEEIARAMTYRARFLADPEAHTFDYEFEE